MRSDRFMLDAIVAMAIGISSGLGFVFAAQSITVHYNIQDCVLKGHSVEYCRDLWGQQS